MDPNILTREVKTAWKGAKEQSGVKCRFHDLRHTACTRLLERGASFPVVAAIMGWSASATAAMAKRYGHIGSDVQRAALAALDDSSSLSPRVEESEGAQAAELTRNF